MAISNSDKQFLLLISRSPDHGDGWRSVSQVCWPLVESFETPELIQIDKDAMRIRLTEAGKAVVTFGI